METQIKERPQIAMIKVESSQLAKIGHDTKTNTLAIEFPPSKSQPDGSLYHYRNFTKNDFALFSAAESKGSYFKKFIKAFPDAFPYERVR